MRKNRSGADAAAPRSLRRRAVGLLRRFAGARPGTVCLGGYAGCGNLGDDAIVQGYLARLVRQGAGRELWGARVCGPAPEPGGQAADPAAWGGEDGTARYAFLLGQVTLLSGVPRRDARRFGVRCAGRRNPFALLRAFLQSEVFLCGGGSLLQNATGRLSLAYYLGLLRLARLCGCRTGLLAAGIGPLTGERARRAVVRELNRCCRVELRDPDSACLLRSLGVRRELLARAPDPALFLPLPPPSRLPYLLWEAGIPASRGYFCAVLHPPAGRDGEAMRAVVSALGQVAARQGLLPVFLLFDRADRCPSARAAAAVGGRVLHLREAADAVALLSGAHFLFAMRLHALILSVQAGVPALALTLSVREDKLAAFARAAGIPHLREPSETALVSGMERLLAEGPRIRAALPGLLAELRAGDG